MTSSLPRAIEKYDKERDAIIELLTENGLSSKPGFVDAFTRLAKLEDEYNAVIDTLHRSGGKSANRNKELEKRYAQKEEAHTIICYFVRGYLGANHADREWSDVAINRAVFRIRKRYQTYEPQS